DVVEVPRRKKVYPDWHASLKSPQSRASAPGALASESRGSSMALPGEGIGWCDCMSCALYGMYVVRTMASENVAPQSVDFATPMPSGCPFFREPISNVT